MSQIVLIYESRGTEHFQILEPQAEFISDKAFEFAQFSIFKCLIELISLWTYQSSAVTFDVARLLYCFLIWVLYHFFTFFGELVGHQSFLSSMRYVWQPHWSFFIIDLIIIFSSFISLPMRKRRDFLKSSFALFRPLYLFIHKARSRRRFRINKIQDLLIPRLILILKLFLATANCILYLGLILIWLRVRICIH